MLVFHHSDLDGFCSAAIILQGNPEAKCIAANYEKPLPVELCKGQDVVIVDFTPTSKEQFDAIVNNANSVTWIDHHHTNIVNYPEYANLPGKRVERVPSGAMLTWQYFHGNEPPPPAVELTSDFDTWTFDYSNSLAFHDGMSSLDCSPESSIWKSLLRKDDWTNSVLNRNQEQGATVQYVVSRGIVVRDFLNIQAKEILERFGWVTEFEGYKAVACCTPDRGSMFFDSLQGFDLMLSYCHTGEKFTVGVYSKNKEIHCGELAKKYGGGGHVGAAGLTCDKLPFAFKGRLT